MDWNDMKLRVETALAAATQAKQIVDDALLLSTTATGMKQRAAEGDVFAMRELDAISDVMQRHPDVQAKFAKAASEMLALAAVDVFAKLAVPRSDDRPTNAPTVSPTAVAEAPADPPKGDKPKLTPEAAVEYALNALANESTPDAITAYIKKARARRDDGFFTQEQADRIVDAAEARLEVIPKAPGPAEIF